MLMLGRVAMVAVSLALCAPLEAQAEPPASIASGKPTPTGHRAGRVRFIDYVDKDRIITCGDDATVRWWSASTLEELGRAELPPVVSRNPTGQRWIVQTRIEAAALVGERVVAQIPSGPLDARGEIAWSVASWHAGTWTTLVAPNGAKVQALAPRGNGAVLLAQDNSLYEFSADGTLRAMGSVPGTPSWIGVAGDEVIFGDDPRKFAAEPMGLLHRAMAGGEPRKLAVDYPHSLLPARAAPIVAVRFHSSVRVLGLGKERVDRTVPISSGLLALSRDGLTLALAPGGFAERGQVSIVDTKSGAAHSLQSDPEEVEALAFAPDARVLTLVLTSGIGDDAYPHVLTNVRVSDGEVLARSRSASHIVEVLAVGNDTAVVTRHGRSSDRAFLVGPTSVEPLCGRPSVGPGAIESLAEFSIGDGLVVCDSTIGTTNLLRPTVPLGSAPLPETTIGEVRQVGVGTGGKLLARTATGIWRVDPRSFVAERLVSHEVVAASYQLRGSAEDDRLLLLTIFENFGATVRLYRHGQMVPFATPVVSPRSLGFMPGSPTRLLVVSSQLELSVLDVAKTVTPHVVPLDEPVSFAVAAAPDEALVGTARGEIVRVALPTGALRGRIRAHAGAIRSMGFDATTGRLSVSGEDGFVTTWTKDLQPLGSFLVDKNARVTRFDAKGRLIASPPPDPKPELLVNAASIGSDIAVAPDGAYLATWGDFSVGESLLTVWDIRLGVQVHRTKAFRAAWFDARGGLWMKRESGFARWDPKTFRDELVDFDQPHDAQQLYYAMSADGTTLAFTTDERCPQGMSCLVFADTASRRQRSLQVPDLMGLGAVALDGSGARVVVSRHDGRFEVYDTRTAKALWAGRIGAIQQIPWRFVLHPTRPILAAIGWDQRLVVHDFATGVTLATLPGCTAIDFDPSGRHLVGIFDGKPAVRELARLEQPPRVFEADALGVAGSAVVRGNALWVGISGFADGGGSLTEWDFGTGIHTRTLEPLGVTTPEVIDAHADGAFLLTTGRSLWHFDPRAQSLPTRLVGPVPNGVFAADAHGLVRTVVAESRQFATWDPRSGRATSQFPRAKDVEDVGSIVGLGVLAFARSGRFALGKTDEHLLIVEADGGRWRRLVAEPGIRDIAIAPDESWGVAASAKTGQEAVIAFELPSGKIITRVAMQTFAVPRFAPESNEVYMATGDRLMVMDRAGRTTQRLAGLELLRFDVAADGLLYGTSWDGQVVAIEPTTARVRWSLNVTGVRFDSIGCAARARRCLVAGSDNLVRIIDSERGLVVASMVLSDAGASVLMLADGRYAASRTAMGGIAVRSGKNIFSFQDIDAFWNRPDEVAAALGAASPAEITRLAKLRSERIKRLGVESAKDPTLAPPLDVRFGEAVALRTSEDRVVISVTIAGDPSAFPARLTGYANGSPAPVVEVTQPGTVQLTLRLAPGPNVLRVVARASTGVRAPPIVTSIARMHTTSAPRRYLLSIGLSRYRDPSLDNLSFARADAEALSASLREAWARDPGPSAASTLVSDEAATTERILRELDMLATLRPEDVVVISFAGHGLVEPSGYVLATYDTKLGSATATGITMAAFEAKLAAIPAQKKLVLLDACHGGELALDEKPAASVGSGLAVRGVVPRVAGPTLFEPIVEEVFTDLRDTTGAQILAASTGKQYAIETATLGHGVFTWAILDALDDLTNLDQDGNGRLSVRELQARVTKVVVAETRGRQVPVSRRENPELDFTLISIPPPSLEQDLCFSSEVTPQLALYKCPAYVAASFALVDDKGVVETQWEKMLLAPFEKQFVVTKEPLTMELHRGAHPGSRLLFAEPTNRKTYVAEGLLVGPHTVAGTARGSACIAFPPVPTEVARCKRIIKGFSRGVGLAP